MKKDTRATITTSPDGYLAKSKAFEATANRYDFDIMEREIDVEFDVDSDEIDCAVQTDGGKEFTAHAFKETVNVHGYHHEVTAPDASSQNGMAERPHRTLKEKMRCMLYSARLGTEF